VRLGVAFAWHSLAWEDLLDLVRRAEAAGFAAAYVDGDVSMLGSRGERDVLDGWTVTTALLASTSRIQVGSIRLVHHWNAARLAQAGASAERISPRRLRFFASIGERPEDRRFGLPMPPVADRIAWLDETLDAVRALWRGEAVTRAGRFVRLDGARVRPVPPAGALPIEVGARRRALLRVVARHAAVWNVNLPAIPARVARAGAWLADACAEVGRDPGEIRRCQWMFTRVQARPDAGAALAEFRRLNPWFADLSDAEVAPSLVVGDAARCRERLAQLARDLALDLPVLDLSGADAETVRRCLDAFPGGGVPAV
jgi:alkanesulfonate monooxygenase SsuD/methylene tetrahydromethanopterin reductase-like flavin-dependent oxidoreductase (luciferase family)